MIAAILSELNTWWGKVKGNQKKGGGTFANNIYLELLDKKRR